VNRRGALLMETILALAIFVMAGTAVLSLMRGAAGGLIQAREMEKAADLARSAMAKMEAGLATPQTLNGPVRPWLVEDAEKGERHEGADEGASTGWELEIDTEKSQFTGLTSVTVRAVKRDESGGGRASAGMPEVSYTLRQLVRLGGKGEDKAGDADPLVEIARKGAGDQKLGGSEKPPAKGGKK
jgi:hypothetical protein